MNRLSNSSLAHGLARLGLGVNIALHGFTRLPNLETFASGLREQFAQSILPAALVSVSGYGIAIGEAVIGTLLVLGLFMRSALVAGSVLMILLLAGTCLIQNWNAAAIQMTYLGFYGVLLATAKYDRLSLDAWSSSKAANLALDHIQIAVPLEAGEKAREFYGEILGLEEIPVPVSLRDRACCWFRCGDLGIHIGTQADFRPSKKGHPAFKVRDLESLRRTLVARHCPIIEDQGFPGVRRFFTEDPWGNRLEFLHHNTHSI